MRTSGRAGRQAASANRRAPWAAAWAGMLACLAVGLAACGSSAAPSAGSGSARQLTKFVVAVPGNNGDFNVWSVAAATSFPRQNGIDLVVDNGLSPPAIPAALIRGDVQGGGDTGTIERSARSGLAVVSVASFAVSGTEALLAAPGITSVAQLAGKQVVTSQLTATPAVLLESLLKKDLPGLAGTVKVVPVASVSGRDTLFVSGTASGLMNPLNLDLQAQAARPGSRVLDTELSLPASPGAGLGVSKAYLAANPATVTAVLKTILETQHFIKTNRAGAVAMFQRIYRLTKAEAEQFWALTAKTITYDLVPTPAEFGEEAILNTEALHEAWTAQQVASEWNTSIAAKVTKELDYAAS